MSRSRILLAVLITCAATGLGACGDQHRDERQTGIRSGSPERIIAIAPSISEMLFALGLGERVVGVGDYAEWPPEVDTKPRLGGLFNARLEAIAALDPDLAVLSPGEEGLRSNLQAMGVEVLVVPSETLADVEQMARLIGRRCGVESAAEAFVERFWSELEPRRRSESIGVLLSVTRQPGRLSDVLVAGPGTFLDELLGRLGVVNVMADAPMEYPQVGLEEIILRRPEVVIELQAAPGVWEGLRVDWDSLAGEPALADLCVEVVAGNHVLVPGPRVPRLYRELDEALARCEGAS